MRALPLALLVWPSLATAAVLNVEFKFTPFLGDAAKEEKVESVPGIARVVLNGVPYAEQLVQKQELPVMFDEREIAPAVWVPVESMGPAVRKGKNSIRIEFDPSDPKTSYTAQLRWASVTDRVREEKQPGGGSSTNQAVYKALDGQQGVDVAKVRKAKCLDAAYNAGVGLAGPSTDQLEYLTPGRPEVVIQRKDGSPLYAPDRAAFDKIKGDETQMCAGVALMAAYPQRLVVVHAPEGAWQPVP